jgi:hypothetical protein
VSARRGGATWSCDVFEVRRSPFFNYFFLLERSTYCALGRAFWQIQALMLSPRTRPRKVIGLARHTPVEQKYAHPRHSLTLSTSCSISPSKCKAFSAVRGRLTAPARIRIDQNSEGRLASGDEEREDATEEQTRSKARTPSEGDHLHTLLNLDRTLSATSRSKRSSRK